jgi:hypothetical protein
MPIDKIDWEDEGNVTKLVRLYNQADDQGEPRYSLSAIGREFGYRGTDAKNMIGGKLGRLRKAGYELAERKPTNRRSTEPSAPRPKGRTIADTVRELSEGMVLAARLVARPAPPPQVPNPMPEKRASTPCCWLIDEPGTKNSRFCEVPSLVGKPFCASHAKDAYVKRSTPKKRLGSAATAALEDRRQRKMTRIWESRFEQALSIRG